MRTGLKVITLSGLFAFVLSCLIGLAADQPASDKAETPFAVFQPSLTQTPMKTETPPAKYVRNRPIQTAQLPESPQFTQFEPLAVPNGEEPLIHADHPTAHPPEQRGSVTFVDGIDANSTPLINPKPADVPLLAETPFLAIPPVPVPDDVAIVQVNPLPNDHFKPTTGPQTATVTLEWVRRTEINVGQECQCDLVVTNAGKVAARDVLVRAIFPPSVRLLPKTTPAPNVAKAELEWQLGTLEPQQAKTMQVHLIPSRREELKTSAFAQFTTAAETEFRVQEPLLAVELKGPTEMQVGDPASQIIQVTNPGTGTARNVEIKVLIPEGLEHPQGSQLTMAIGSLNPGETRMVRLAMAAATGGNHQIKVLAEAKLSPEAPPYLRQLTETEIRVISPSVKVAIDGPGLRYKGRNATYDVLVTNDGTAVSNNVRVMHKVPDGFAFVSATEGGKFDALTKTVAWFVGRIEPGQSSKMLVTLEAAQLGDFVQQVSAMTDQGARGEDRLETKVEGISSLVLEVKDLDDPVEVGVETAYEIQVRNLGTKEAQHVSLACELPEGVELIDVKAPARHQLQGRVVVFTALPALEPDQAAVYRVHVRGQADGLQRFRARLSSQNNQEPLLVEELTRFYGE